MGLFIGIGNYIGRGLIRGGGTKPTFPEGLIARYSCYDKTNEDEDRDVLKDLSGNGHNIQLYNFAFTEESGYNKSTYKGALVSDGVDDYGLCDNFPILDRDRGFTIVYIRKFLYDTFPFNKSAAFFRINNGVILESFDNNNETMWYNSFGTDNRINEYFKSDLICGCCTSKKYNNVDIVVGSINNSNNILCIFDNNTKIRYGNIAFYSMEIYDRDLTDEEIAKVKARMIAEYETKTGDKYVEYLKLDQGKLDINKLK